MDSLLSNYLPLAVKISGEYCWWFSTLILCPMSVFLLGNTIVVSVLAKSGFFSKRNNSISENTVVELEKEIEYEDKEIICQEHVKIVNNKLVVDDDDEEEFEEALCFEEIKKGNYGKIQSDNVMNEEDISDRLLWRSENEICGKKVAENDEISQEDDMSNEEFQRTIQAFIDKQATFHRHEQQI